MQKNKADETVLDSRSKIVGLDDNSQGLTENKRLLFEIIEEKEELMKEEEENEIEGVKKVTI